MAAATFAIVSDKSVFASRFGLKIATLQSDKAFRSKCLLSVFSTQLLMCYFSIISYCNCQHLSDLLKRGPTPQVFSAENKWPLSGKQHALLCLSQCFNLSQYPFPIVDVLPLLIVAELTSPAGMGFHTLS